MSYPNFLRNAAIADLTGVSEDSLDKTIKRSVNSLALALGAGPRVLSYVGATGTADILPYAALSTFSGWSAAIGVRQNFNRIVVEINADDAADLPYNLRVRLRETSISGTIVATTSAFVKRVSSGTFTRVFIDFPSVITNAGGAALILEIVGNGIFRIRPTTSVVVATPVARYTTAQTLELSSWATPVTNFNIFAEFYLVESLSKQQVWFPAAPIASDSTFACWGWLLGAMQAFDTLEVTLRVPNASFIPKNIRFVIRDTDHTGTILGEVTVPITASAPSVVQVLAQFMTSIGNGSTVLWVDMLTDGYVIPYGTAAGVPATPKTRYATTTNTRAVLNQQVVTNQGVWTNLMLQDGVDFALGPQTILAAISAIGSGSSATPYTPQVALAVPPYIYGVENREMNVYFDGVLRAQAGIAWQECLDVICSKGKQERERWTWVPGSSDAGTYDWAMKVKWNNEDLITSPTSTLRIADSAAGGGSTRKDLVIADSTWAGNQAINEVASFFAADANMDVTFIGTKDTAASGNKHEAISGWSINVFYTSTGSNFSDGLGGFLPKSPFLNGSNVFDFAWYLTQNSLTMSSGDWVSILLGINDNFSYATNTAANAGIPTTSAQLAAMITNIKAAVSGVRIAIGLPIPPARSEDAFGDDYFSGQTRQQYLQNLGLWREHLIAIYGASEASNIYLLPLSVCLDTVYNFPGTQSGDSAVSVNSRNTGITVKRQNNGVHPADPGYLQTADKKIAFLKYHA